MRTRKAVPVSALALAMACGAAHGQAFQEGFNDITTLPGSGWFIQNNSNPVGGTSWGQGADVVFPAHVGAPNAFISANYNNAGPTPPATISNWLVTPSANLQNGDTFTFFARSIDSTFPDRLQVRLSTAGTSTNVGFSETDVGDFTTLLLDINPTYVQGAFPNTWTQHSITLSGLPAGGVAGRMAFRYFVEDAGLGGLRSDFIGIDEVAYLPVGTPIGACCFADGTCSVGAQTACTNAGGTYSGDGTNCSTANCPQPGACCMADGTCSFGSQAQCTTAGGTFQGGGTACATANCPQPPGTYNYAGGPVAIPDGPDVVGCGPTAVAEVTVPDSFNVTGASVSVFIPITWQGDIQFRLVHGATSVPLAVRPGVNPSSGFGFAEDNYGASANDMMRFADSGAMRYAEPDITIGINNVTGTWKPESSTMSAFVGSNASGVWRIEAEDCAFGITGTIEAFRLNLEGMGGSTCYANCDNSTNTPFLNVLDFNCFLNQFNSGASYANCDNSTNQPILNVLDFNCFLNKFNTGCSAP